MANTYAKKQADHASDYNVHNNGGLVVGPFKGATPEQQVGDKVSETPSVNKAVVESEQ